MAKKKNKSGGKGSESSGGPKKKLSKKELEEQARKQRELEEQMEREEAERKARLAEEKRLKKLKAAKEAAEQAVRDDLLQKTCQMFNELKEEKIKAEVEERSKEEWSRWVDPEGLPCPEIPPAMNTHLFLWRSSETTSYLDSFPAKLDEVSGLLAILDDLLDNPLDRNDPRIIENWREVRESYRREVQRRIDLGCFHVMRDMEAWMERDGLFDANFHFTSTKIPPNTKVITSAMKEAVILSKVKLALSTRYPVPAPPRPAPCLDDSENSGMTFTLPQIPYGPVSAWRSPVVLRVMRLRYDHVSDTCRTWKPPRLMPEFDRSLYDFCLEKWNDKEFLKKEREEARRREKELQKAMKLAALPWWMRPKDGGGADTGSMADDEDEGDQPEIRPENEQAQEMPGEGEEIEGEGGEEGSDAEKLTEEEIKEEEELVTDAGPEDAAQAEATEGPKAAWDESSSDTLFSEARNPSSEIIIAGVIMPEEEPVNVYDSPSDDWGLSHSSLRESSTEDTGEDESDDPEGLAKAGRRIQMVTMEKETGMKLAPRKEKGRRPETEALEGAETNNLQKLVRAFEILKVEEDTGPKIVPRPTIRRRSTMGVEAKSGDPMSDVPDEERSPSEIMEESEVLALEELDEWMKTRLYWDDELSLRKYRVIGGVYHADLLWQPPQRMVLKDRSKVALLEGDYNIRREPFTIDYRPPAILEDEDNQDEGEVKSKASNEDLGRLAKVDIRLPEDVLWWEPPTPVQWDAERKVWTNRWVFESKYNEDKRIISFCLGLLADGPLGLAAYRFSNLPYQTWELKPVLTTADKENREILLSITANIVIVEFTIKGGLVRLKALQNATGAALEKIIGQWYQPHALIRLMRNGGVDIFPDEDTYLYVEGSAVKDFVVEYHLYHCMALLSAAFNFTWSRWNLLAGRMKMVLQMREMTCPKKLPNYSTLLVRRDASLMVDCTEVSPAFVEDNAAGEDDFRPDLKELASAVSSSRAKAIVESTESRLIETVYFMLKSTKVLSYS